MQIKDPWMQAIQLMSMAAQNSPPPQSNTQPKDSGPSFQDLMQQRQQQLKPQQDGQAQPEQSAPAQTPVQEEGDAALAQAMAAALCAQAMMVVPDQSDGVPAQSQLPQVATPAQMQVAVQVQPQVQQAQPQVQQQQVDAPQPVQQQIAPAVQPQAQDQTQQNTDGQQPNQPKLTTRPEEQVTLTQGTAPEQPVFQNVEHIPIKVAEAHAPVDTQSADMDSQLVGKLEKAMDVGDYRVEIKLAPQSLGSVVVEMTRSADGSLQVVLQASNAKAAGILKEHASNLGTLLQLNTQAPVQVEVQRQQDTPNSHNWQQQDDGRGQQQQQQQQQRHQERSDDFLQQLRLGLLTVPT